MTQPPQKDVTSANTLQGYIEQLRAITARQLAASEKKKAPARQTEWEPLDTQIRRWWINLPSALQHRRFQISEIASICRGSHGKPPALRDVAHALRALGWSEFRDWTNAGRNRRFWMPSTNSWPHRHSKNKP
jgi:hypothetical protein